MLRRLEMQMHKHMTDNHLVIIRLTDIKKQKRL